MNTLTTYYVWRRSDGYVDATTYPPGRAYTDSNGFLWSYDVLLTTTDWPEARSRIERERAAVPADKEGNER